MTKFKNIHYTDLTEVELNSLNELELIEKFLLDDIKRIEKYFSICSTFRKHIIGTILIGLTSFFIFGLLSLLTLIPLIIFIVLFKKNKTKMKWCVKSFKTTVSMYRGNGNFLKSIDYVFEKNIRRINHIDIGPFYDVTE